jgi:hypothetical protein
VGGEPIANNRLTPPTPKKSPDPTSESRLLIITPMSRLFHPKGWVGWTGKGLANLRSRKKITKKAYATPTGFSSFPLHPTALAAPSAPAFPFMQRYKVRHETTNPIDTNILLETA